MFLVTNVEIYCNAFWFIHLSRLNFSFWCIQLKIFIMKIHIYTYTYINYTGVNFNTYINYTVVNFNTYKFLKIPSIFLCTLYTFIFFLDLSVYTWKKRKSLKSTYSILHCTNTYRMHFTCTISYSTILQTFYFHNSHC